MARQELVPLQRGSSRETISRNIATERRAGKPEKQAIAIAYHEAGESRGGKRGGQCRTCGRYYRDLPKHRATEAHKREARKGLPKLHAR